MTVETLEKIYTVEEFFAFELAENAEETDYEFDEALELIEGVTVRKGTTNAKHGNIAAKIVIALGGFNGETSGEERFGKIYVGVSTDLGNPKGIHAPKPAVCFVSKEQSPDNFEGIIPVAPDLVVEVNSPSDTDERRFEKLQAYQQSGVKLIWSVHMLEKFVLVYKLGEPYPKLLTLADELEGATVLPVFKLAVKSLFE
jgi:Uma2 family endonuclease